jgi:plasmid stabilization system protein ParE
MTCAKSSRSSHADNPTGAESFGYQLMSKVDLLANIPQLGRVVPVENDENVREMILRPCRIVYRVLPARQVVANARIWHGARGETIFRTDWNSDSERGSTTRSGFDRQRAGRLRGRVM